MYHDLTQFDHIDNNLYYDPETYLDMEKYEETEEIIFNQLIDFNNLGTNLLKEINLEEDYNIENRLYYSIIDHCKENYIVLPDTDYQLEPNKLKLLANIAYQFICVDCYSVIIPKIINDLNVDTPSQFDINVFHRHSYEPFYIKHQIISNISIILDKLLKLQALDPSIKDDKKYKKLVERFGRYLELIDFSDPLKLLNNYIRPVVHKNFEDLYWRSI